MGKIFHFCIHVVQLETKNPFSSAILNPRDLVLPFIDALENFATQSKNRTRMNFHRTETATRSRLARIQETLTQRRGHCVGVVAEDDNFENSSTQFPQMQKKSSH